MKLLAVERVQLNGFSMDYLRFGRGENPLVILPGLSAERVLKSAKAIQEAYSALEEDFTLFLFERRNALPEVYPVSQMAEDTAAAMKALGLTKVNLFGASQGGMMAIFLAANYPSLVKKVALASTSSRMTEERFARIQEWISLARAKEREKLYLSFGEAVYPASVFFAIRENLIAMAKEITNEELQRFVILAEGTKNFCASEQLKRIACPVLLTGSKDDAVLGFSATEEIERELALRVPLARHYYEEYGHASYDTAPDFKTVLKDFFLHG